MSDKIEIITNKVGEEDSVNLFNLVESNKALAQTATANISSALSAFYKNTAVISERIGKGLTVAINNAIKAFDFYNNYQETIHSVFDSIINTIKNAIDNFHLPTITEEEKEELVRSYDQWGKFGWTLIPNSPIKFYDHAPECIDDANKKAEQYCKKEDIAQLFDGLRKKNVKKCDLEEAIFCFENKQYKSCALILCGIIDAKLIRKMPKPKKENKTRPSGITAIKELKRQIDIKFKIDGGLTLFELLCYTNLFSCLSTVFAKGNDFKEEPAVINRNFIGHGMNRREVRRRDCIQLFLLLNNFVEFLDII